MNAFLNAGYMLEGYLLGVLVMYVYMRTNLVHWNRLMQGDKNQEIYLWITAFLWPLYLIEMIVSLIL